MRVIRCLGNVRTPSRASAVAAGLQWGFVMVSVPLDRPVGEPDQPGELGAERRVLLDLMRAGVFVNSLWDLLDSAAPLACTTRARRVLQHHLEHGDHPPEVVDTLRRALVRGA